MNVPFGTGMTLALSGSIMLVVLGATNSSVASQLGQLPAIIAALIMVAFGIGLAVGGMAKT
ncbi:MAG: hypothetical protein KGI38_12360 [Thaumarchaeota archaeon]|nr:hypothetical protein [Nitrososphaerota archaeon]